MFFKLGCGLLPNGSDLVEGDIIKLNTDGCCRGNPSEVATPWVIAFDVKGIRRMLQQLDYSIQHIYLLANWGFKENKCIIFCNNNLPKKLVGILRIDKAGLSDLRL